MLWKILTFVFATTSVAFAVLLIKQYRERKFAYEPRLIGTWISDKERTKEHFPEHMSEAQKEQLSSLFGKLRVTYSESSYTSELDGHIETTPYTVLGADQHSVVIRDDSVQKPEMEVFEMSTFSKIYFVGRDTYWVTTEIGGVTVYFRRVSIESK